jgi:hypothetical protein
MMKLIIPLMLLCLSACTALPPKNADNICLTFKEQDDWYQDALQAYQKWGVPVAVQMAIMHQESHFVADAEPPRPWLLGIIPWFSSSSAYGYAQAKDESWGDYLDSAGSLGADRDNFADACDFIGWYCQLSYRRLGIAKTDTKNLYLAYHEGHQGFRKNSHVKKAWLLRIADKVDKKAKLFQKQLQHCQINGVTR